MEEKVIGKFSDIYDFIEKISQNPSNLYFRGLENSTYEVMPSIFYANKEKKDKRLKEGISLVDLKKDAKEAIQAYSKLNSIESHKTSNPDCNKLSDLDVLALYQHHRLSGSDKFKNRGTFLIDLTTDCTATGNSGHSLRQDYGIISIYLKGVSDGETQTKKLHSRV